MSELVLPTCICCHDDDAFLGQTIATYSSVGPVYVFVSRLAWNGTSGPWERCAEAARSAEAEIIIGDWPDESLHRSTALAWMAKKYPGSFCLIPDGDEPIAPKLLQTLVGLATARIASRVHVHMDTYWKSPEYVVRPREALTPVIMVDLGVVKHSHVREYIGGTKLVLGPEFDVIHHLSYCGTDERIERKITSWGHRTEVIDGWFERIWKGWDADPMLRNLHPTHPPAYHKVERIRPPEILSAVTVAQREEIVPSISWPTISMVIPLHGGETDIRRCLESLGHLKDLVFEIVVVDDKSPDKAASVAEGFDGVKLFRNESNLGFAATCNAGFAQTSGEVIIFLNSDTIVTRAGLIRLIESLMASRSIAAAGPYSNNTGHHQQIASTYESLETMPLFADDLARMEVEDVDVDMLVGFCLAVKREILDEVGVFDTRFGIGMFEDNDLCYRMRRAGFRLVLSRRAFVHHEGSKSLGRRKEHPAVLLSRNQDIYLKKWKDDLECGFVNHLSGMSSAPIMFEPKNKPEEIDRRIRKLAKQADVCLCMIVKNEERVLADCLSSAYKGVVQLVIVDTGSSDRTMEIARPFASDLHEIVWPNSFSVARNVSLKYARTRWILWLDADDTIDRRSLELLLQAVIHAKKDIGGFVVPVRFVDEGPNAGTHVDHVKVLRVFPGLCFENRIHEQVLTSIRRKGLEIVRIKDCVVHHSGYDTSVEGQVNKRLRDEPLLKLDHEEDPENPFKMFNLGMTCHFMREHKRAIDWLERSIAASGPNESHLRKAYALMGVSKRELEDLDGAMAIFDTGLFAAPEDPELLYQSALLLTRLERLAEAKDRYLRVNPDTSGHFSSIDVGILTFKRFHNLGTVCMAMGSYGEALAWWRKAIETAPRFSPSAVEMYEAAMRQADYRTAREALDALRTAEGPTENWASKVCRLASETGEDPQQALRQILNAFPYAMGPLLLLARSLIERGDERGAAPILEELDRLGCAEGAFFRGLSAIKRMDLAAGLEHMVRARDLNPHHEPTNTQIKELRRILREQLPPKLLQRGRAVLHGPHAGTLGPGSCHASVVVVSYNSARTIGRCIDCVLSTLGPDDELIVVDNASTDGTRLVLQGYSDSRVQFIQQDSNLGYSKAANIGLLATKGEILVTLNPDAYVNAGWLESLASRLDGDVAAVAPISDNVGGDQFVGHLLGERHPDRSELPQILAEEFAGKTQDTLFLVGICIAVKRETMNMHGLLDEGTELGADDLEFSFRMRMLGYRVVIAQDVFVQHEQGVSFASLPDPERIARQMRSDFALYRKLEAFYDGQAIPSSTEQWGTPIFDEAYRRFKLIEEDDGA